jgi:hypothetical protein
MLAVPCHRRASAYEKDYVEETEVEAEDGAEEGWLATHITPSEEGGE